MPRTPDLVGTHVGRPESPEAELLVQEAIGRALSLLLTKKGLYQKVELDLENLRNHLNAQKLNSFEALTAEFSKRPWVPVSLDVAKENRQRAEFFCGVGDSPLGTPSDGLKLAFGLPPLKLYCDLCKDEHSFSSVTAMWWDGLTDAYPKIGLKTQQLFCLTYQCVNCKQSHTTALVNREGLRLTLAGRSKRLPIDVPKVIPKELQPIMRDAISAASENDIPAAFYHARTFLEHYMKTCLKLSLSLRITGDELGAMYNASLDNRMTSGMPSLPALYASSSENMHSRTGSEDDFAKLLEAIEGHLNAKELFLRYRTET
jgi:hypothetical protein